MSSSTPFDEHPTPGTSSNTSGRGEMAGTGAASVASTSTASGLPPPRPRNPVPPSATRVSNSRVIDDSSSSSYQRHFHHQPHGVAAIGPSLSMVSASSTNISHQQQQQQQHVFSLESPLPPMVQRSLGDRSNEKRKNAALEIEALVRSLQEANNTSMIQSVIAVLSKDFCTSMNSNYRKGGLVGLAGTAIGLSNQSKSYLQVLLPPVLHCFDDPESRVRFYACESVYNIAKVSRQAILEYFNPIFEGLTKLYADVDIDVKNGANLLDRLIKDIVTEADHFDVHQFLPLLQNYIRRSNPYIRQLIVGWITLLDSIPDISMLDYLPDFLDGLFNMLADSNREIRQAADSALSEFLRELSVSTVVEFGPIISILVVQCKSPQRLNRLTAATWLAELIHHPQSGGDVLLPYHAEILQAILSCISDVETDIRLVADRTNDDFLITVQTTDKPFELKPLLDTCQAELKTEDVPTKMASLRWINMLLEKCKGNMREYTAELLPNLLRTLSDPSDAVVLLDLQVLSRISLAQSRRKYSGGRGGPQLEHEEYHDEEDDDDDNSETEELQFQLVLNAILNLFAQDRQLLETRGSLIIRKLCVLLNAKSVYIRMADTLASYEIVNEEPSDYDTLQFISTMVQTLNLILLTAQELHELRTTLARSFQEEDLHHQSRVDHSLNGDIGEDDNGNVFATLFHCWCHNPVATFSLCLLAQAYDLSFCLVQRFAQIQDVTVSFLMQMDKLVHLLESPIFLQLRLQLLEVDTESNNNHNHTALLKSIYGVLMCLPQGDAFRLLNDRLTTVCNLRDNLGINKSDNSVSSILWGQQHQPVVSRKGLDMDLLLERFDSVMDQHEQAKERTLQQQQQQMMIHSSGGTAADRTFSEIIKPAKRTMVIGGVPGSANTGGASGTSSLVQQHLLHLNTAEGGTPTRITVHHSTREPRR